MEGQEVPGSHGALSSQPMSRDSSGQSGGGPHKEDPSPSCRMVISEGQAEWLSLCRLDPLYAAQG